MVPIIILVITSVVLSLVIDHSITRGWYGVLLSAGISTFLWVGGIFLLFWWSAPNELGKPLFLPILFAFLTALIPALLIHFSRLPSLVPVLLRKNNSMN